jgi:hypothetical protein
MTGIATAIGVGVAGLAAGVYSANKAARHLAVQEALKQL